MTTNGIIDQYSDSGIKLLIKPIEGHSQLIKIEGDSNSFEFFGKLILAMVEDQRRGKNDFDWMFEPGGAGKNWLKKGSTRGLYFLLLERPKKSAMKAQSERRKSKP